MVTISVGGVYTRSSAEWHGPVLDQHYHAMNDAHILTPLSSSASKSPTLYHDFILICAYVMGDCRMYHRIRDTGQPLSMRTKVTILHNPEEAFSNKVLFVLQSPSVRFNFETLLSWRCIANCNCVWFPEMIWQCTLSQSALILSISRPQL